MMDTTAKSPVVSITGGTVWGNRGAEAMLVTAIGRVRKQFPDATFYVFSYVPKRDRTLIHDPRVTVLSAKPASLVLRHFPFALLCWVLKLIGVQVPDRYLSGPVRALRNSDVLLDVSGIAFSDGREKFLPFNILLIWPALLLGVPVVKLAQALGPFKNPLNRLCAKLFLPRCSHVYARGDITASHLEDLKLPRAKWDLSADVAFLYEPEFSLSSENETQVAVLDQQLLRWRDEGASVIGIIPSSLVAEKSDGYVQHFTTLVRALGSQYRFVFLPNATRAGTDKIFNNDLYVIDLVERAVRQDCPERAQDIAYVTYDINTAATRKLIRNCDVVVTSRFHGMISSLCLGVPPVVIGWSHKYVEVLAEFGLEQLAVDFNDPQLDVVALMDRVTQSKEELRGTLASALASIQDRAGRQFDYVEHLLRAH
jgi:polysaccharide pyruvyl transferase WcaK-like protein